MAFREYFKEYHVPIGMYFYKLSGSGNPGPTAGMFKREAMERQLEMERNLAMTYWRQSYLGGVTQESL